MRFFKQPFVHFFVIGVVIFLLNSYRQAVVHKKVEAVDKEAITLLGDEFVRQTGRMPTPEQLHNLAEQELEQRILFAEALSREYYRDDSIVLQRLLLDAQFLGLPGSEEEQIRAAIALGLHTSDEVVRRRMIQRMEVVARAQYAQGRPSEVELERLYSQEAERWLVPARFHFRQIFFSADQGGGSEDRARALLGSLQPDTDISKMGDPFLQGQEFAGKSLHDIALIFGTEFSTAITELPVGQWRGPMASAYGWHLVQVLDKAPESQLSLEQVKPRLLRLWQESRERDSLRRFIDELRGHYDVVETGGQS